MNYLTLKQLTTIIKSTISAISDEYWVVAEIAELRCNVNSGHCYLDLVEKEEDMIVANIRGTIWSRNYKRISAAFLESTGTELRAGIKILMLGKVSYHEVYGLSFNIREIDPAYTLGEMALKRKEIIARLSKEGIIDRNRQLPMPLVPQRIAIISSQTAAGYGDFLHKFESNPYGYRFRTKLFQAYVQGEQAEESILAALRECKSQIEDFDVVVIIRGGGSQVDIHCFDSYQLAREIALFPIPVLTGIGHERDETVVDRVAHKRLITPTAVADFIISSVRSFEDNINDLRNRLVKRSEALINSERHLLGLQSKSLISSLRGYLNTQNHNLSTTIQSFNHTVKQSLSEHHRILDRFQSMLSHNASKYLNNIKYQVKDLSDSLYRYTIQFIRTSETLLKSYLQSLQTNTVASVRTPSVMLKEYEGRLNARSQMTIRMHQQRLKEYSTALKIHPLHILSRRAEALNTLEEKVRLLDPENILKRGYSITLLNGKALKDIKSVKKGDIINTVLYSGTIKSKVEHLEEETKDEQ